MWIRFVRRGAFPIVSDSAPIFSRDAIPRMMSTTDHAAASTIAAAKHPPPPVASESARVVAADAAPAASTEMQRKSHDVIGRRIKWAIGLGVAGIGSYLLNDSFGTPEKTIAFMLAKLEQATTTETKCQILSAMQTGTSVSDALREAMILANGMPQLTKLLADDVYEIRRLSAALLMDITQFTALAHEILACPGLATQIVKNIGDPDKEICMNSLFALTILCSSDTANKKIAFDAGALPALIATVRNQDLDIAHVSCTTIGSIIKSYPEPEILTASLSKKDRSAIVASISQLGQSYVQQGMRVPAIDAFRTCLTLDSCNPSIHNALGQLLQMDGNFSEANDHFRLAIKFAPGLLEAHYNLAVNLTTRGSRKDKLEAIKRMTDAIPFIDPSHPNRFDLMFLLAKTLDSLDRVPEACRIYENILRSSPGLWRAHLALGRLYLKLNDTVRARKALTTACTLQPHDSQAHYQLALCMYREDSLVGAAEECDKALSLSADKASIPNAFLLRGKLYAHQGQWEPALKCFTELARLRPDQPDGHYQMARALQHIGRDDDADAKLCDTLDSWTRTITALPKASSAHYFDAHAADARILQLIGARRDAPGSNPRHDALVRKYDAFRASFL